MTELYSIDPGNAAAHGRVSYVAFFDVRELVDVQALTWKQAAGITPGFGPRVVVIERPQQDGRSGRVPPGVLMGLAWNGALVAASLQPTEIVEYTPREWAGQSSKPERHLKILRVLSKLEKQCLPGDTEERVRKGAEATARNKGKLTNYSFEAHNLLDAIGIGLFHLKRIGKGGARVR
jgi:hypothetical protein